jgi:hypothetical protein
MLRAMCAGLKARDSETAMTVACIAAEQNKVRR